VTPVRTALERDKVYAQTESGIETAKEWIPMIATLLVGRRYDLEVEDFSFSSLLVQKRTNKNNKHCRT
jgi:DNA-binding PadR family transcriptional regulator